MAHKLVYGLGGGLVYSCGSKGKWKTVLPKLLLSVDNDYLISTVDMSQVAAKVIYNTVGQDRLYLDSGGFTLYKYQCKRDTALAALDPNDPDYQAKADAINKKFSDECDRMARKFEKMLQICKYKEIFELDNEYFRADSDPLSTKNYCRELVMKYQGFYPTPVFKMHQGFQYWKDLCDSPLYPKLSIGGLAQTRDWKKHRPELVKMMNYARQCGKKVHLLGCQNVETFKMLNRTLSTIPSSNTQSIWRTPKKNIRNLPHTKTSKSTRYFMPLPERSQGHSCMTPTSEHLNTRALR